MPHSVSASAQLFRGLEDILRQSPDVPASQGEHAVQLNNPYSKASLVLRLRDSIEHACSINPALIDDAIKMIESPFAHPEGQGVSAAQKFFATTRPSIEVDDFDIARATILCPSIIRAQSNLTATIDPSGAAQQKFEFLQNDLYETFSARKIDAPFNPASEWQEKYHAIVSEGALSSENKSELLYAAMSLLKIESQKRQVFDYIGSQSLTFTHTGNFQFDVKSSFAIELLGLNSKTADLEAVTISFNGSLPVLTVQHKDFLHVKENSTFSRPIPGGSAMLLKQIPQSGWLDKVRMLEGFLVVSANPSSIKSASVINTEINPVAHECARAVFDLAFATSPIASKSQFVAALKEIDASIDGSVQGKNRHNIPLGDDAILNKRDEILIKYIELAVAMGDSALARFKREEFALSKSTSPTPNLLIETYGFTRIAGALATHMQTNDLFGSSRLNEPYRPSDKVTQLCSLFAVSLPPNSSVYEQIYSFFQQLAIERPLAIYLAARSKEIEEISGAPLIQADSQKEGAYVLQDSIARITLLLPKERDPIKLCNLLSLARMLVIAIHPSNTEDNLKNLVLAAEETRQLIHTKYPRARKSLDRLIRSCLLALDGDPPLVPIKNPSRQAISQDQRRKDIYNADRDLVDISAAIKFNEDPYKHAVDKTLAFTRFEILLKSLNRLSAGWLANDWVTTNPERKQKSMDPKLISQAFYYFAKHSKVIEIRATHKWQELTDNCLRYLVRTAARNPDPTQRRQALRAAFKLEYAANKFLSDFGVKVSIAELDNFFHERLRPRHRKPMGASLTNELKESLKAELEVIEKYPQSRSYVTPRDLAFAKLWMVSTLQRLEALPRRERPRN